MTLVASFIGYPTFREKYGQWHDEEHGYQISSAWQAGLNDIAAVGNIIGALLNGYFTAKYGHRKTLMFSLAFLTAFIFIEFFSPNIEVLLVGVFLCNIPWGVFATTGPAYAAEVAPLALRGYLTAYEHRASLGDLQPANLTIQIRQLVLVYRPIHLCWCPEGTGQQQISVGIQVRSLGALRNRTFN